MCNCLTARNEKKKKKKQPTGAEKSPSDHHLKPKPAYYKTNKQSKTPHKTTIKSLRQTQKLTKKMTWFLFWPSTEPSTEPPGLSEPTLTWATTGSCYTRGGKRRAPAAGLGKSRKTHRRWIENSREEGCSVSRWSR